MPSISKSKPRPWIKRVEPYEYSHKGNGGSNELDLQFYNSKSWRTLSAQYRKENPVCEVCERKGIIRQATVCDHIKPSRLYPELREDWSNLQALCDSCHQKKSRIERDMKERKDYYRHRGRGVELFEAKGRTTHGQSFFYANQLNE
jgi:RecJ-like exonuclease